MTTENKNLMDIYNKFNASDISLEIRQKTHFLASEYLGGIWSEIGRADGIVIKQILGGLTNLIFLVELPEQVRPEGTEPRCALLRIFYRTEHDILLSEAVVFTMLSERNLGPKVYGVFPGGRFEEYIPSRNLETLELAEPRIARKIAQLMAQVNSLNVPISKTPRIVEAARKWLNDYRELRSEPINIFTTKADVPSGTYPSTVTIDELHKELDFVEYFLKNSGSPVVFCHNDLHEGNILLHNTPDEKLTLIDFEFACYNYRGFDLAHQFCEYAMNYTNEEPPYYRIFNENFQVEKERETFADAYIDEIYRIDGQVKLPPGVVTGDRGTDVKQVRDETRIFMPVTLIIWAMFGLLIAENNPTPFDQRTYAIDRLALYYNQKKFMQEFLQDKNL